MKKQMENNHEKDRYDVRLRKVPVIDLLEILRDLYERGVDYVDILGKNDKEQDVLGFFFNEEYMSNDGGEQESDKEEGDIKTRFDVRDETNFEDLI